MTVRNPTAAPRRKGQGRLHRLAAQHAKLREQTPDQRLQRAAEVLAGALSETAEGPNASKEAAVEEEEP